MAAKWIRTVALAVVAGALVPAIAQAQYNPEKKYFGVNVGLSGHGTAPAIGLNGEMSYNERISIGAFVNMWSYGQSVGVASWNVRYIALGGTGAYHFPIENNPKLDPFLGAAVGYYVVSVSAEGSAGAYGGAAASTILLGGYGGVRYFFRENIAGVARAGVGATYLSVGVDFAL